MGTAIRGLLRARCSLGLFGRFFHSLSVNRCHARSLATFGISLGLFIILPMTFGNAMVLLVHGVIHITFGNGVVLLVYLALRMTFGGIVVVQGLLIILPMTFGNVMVLLVHGVIHMTFGNGVVLLVYFVLRIILGRNCRGSARAFYYMYDLRIRRSVSYDP